VVLNPQFGNDGRVAVELGVYGERANDVVVQPDGKIIVAGSSSTAADNDFMLFRLLADGSLDPDFNYDGTVTTAVGSADDEALTVALQTDGKILAAGYSSNGNDRDFALLRYIDDGSLDRNFGQEGMVVTPVGNQDDEITGIVVLEDGSIVVTGSANGTVGRVVVLARYLADGTLDQEFADRGFSFTGIGDDAQAESVVVLEDGRIAVTGSYLDKNTVGMMVVGYSASGELDEDFGEGGIAINTVGKKQSEGYGMTVRKDGTLLVAGSVGRDGYRDSALFQFTANGEVDDSFDKDGILVTAASKEDDVVYDVIETDSGIAASGYITEGTGKQVLLITYDESEVAVKKGLVRKEEKTTEDAPSWLRISDLLVKDSYKKFASDDLSDVLEAKILTTPVSGDEDFATALAEGSDSSIVAVGITSSGDVPHAAILCYAPEVVKVDPANDPRALDVGSSYILTGEPYDVTRTSAVVPVIVYSDIGAVTERGVIFSLYTNPTLGGVSGKKPGGSPSPPPDNPTDKKEPSRSNLLPSGSILRTSTTLKLVTDVKANCKYSDSKAGVDYNVMTKQFTATGGLSHAQPITGLVSGKKYTYYVRCKNVTTGVANTSDAIISFTVDATPFAEVTEVLNTVGDSLVSPVFAADETEDNSSETTNTATTTETGHNLFSSRESTYFEDGSVKVGAGTGRFTAKLENLQPGSSFYARAYAIVDGVTYYGNTVGFQTGDSCFIATAAFGSVFHPCVKVLRDFRDHFMINNSLGNLLVQQYYRYSPQVADVIATDSFLRNFTRLMLLPLIGLAWLSLQLGTFLGVVLLVVGAGSLVFVMRPQWCVTKL
jgi:uncharacterized delta-60 repeat protein